MMRQFIVKLLSKYPELCISALGEDRDAVLNQTVAKLFNTIGSDDILQVNEIGQWVFEGKVMDKKMYELLIAEAKQLEGMRIWRVIQADLKYKANKAMFLDATDTIGLTAGKLWLFTIDCINTRLNSLKRGRGSFNSG